jgi:AraC-like DNA-binding protein
LILILKQDRLVHQLCHEIALEPVEAGDSPEHMNDETMRIPLPDELAEVVHWQSGGNLSFRDTTLKPTAPRGTGGTRVVGPSMCGKLQRRLLQRVLDRMKADLATDLDLSTLAAESGYSRSHFLRTFRAVMGCSPHQCLTRLRVEHGKTILRENSISLIDIALDCGFSSHAHFSNTFRQIVGLTPSEYRRTQKVLSDKKDSSSQAFPSGVPYSLNESCDSKTRRVAL